MKKVIVVLGIIVLVLGIIRIFGGRNNKTINQKSVTECDKKFDISDPLLAKARDICYVNVARESQNIDLCDEIKDESIKKLCPPNVYYWNKSIDFCKADEQKNICLHIVSIKNRDKTICSRIDHKAIRELCLQEDY